MTFSTSYSTPTTRYLVPSISQCDSICKSHYKVEGDVRSSSYGVKLTDCIIGGSISACEHVKCIHTFCNNILSTSYGAQIASHSLVNGRVLACESVKVSDSTVKGNVTSTSYGATIKSNSYIGGNIQACENIHVLNSTVKGNVTSTSYKIYVKNHSSIEGSLNACEHVHVSDSSVTGNIKSSSYGVKIKNSSISSNQVTACESISISNSSLPNNLEVQSTSYGVTIEGKPESSTKIRKVAACEDINLSWISSDTVCSSSGKVDCVGGQFKRIQSNGSSSLKKANIELLELSVEKGKEITIDLSNSKVKMIAIKTQDQANVIFNYNNTMNYGSTMSINGQFIDWQLGPSQLRAGPDFFHVKGPFQRQFESEIMNRCSVGTKGLVNGSLATVTNFGVSISAQEKKSKEKIRTKVTFIGGKILGNITLKDSILLDTSKTEFLGKAIED